MTKVSAPVDPSIPVIETYDKENGNFTMKIHMNVVSRDAADGLRTNVTTAESGPTEEEP